MLLRGCVVPSATVDGAPHRRYRPTTPTPARQTHLTPTNDLRARLDHLLGGQYRIERELGGGGMSRVFVAEEIALGRRVVVKVLEPELAQGLSADRFAREAKLAARLQDPRIVPVLSAGSAGDLPVL